MSGSDYLSYFCDWRTAGIGFPLLFNSCLRMPGIYSSFQSSCGHSEASPPAPAPSMELIMQAVSPVGKANGRNMYRNAANGKRHHSSKIATGTQERGSYSIRSFANRAGAG